MMGVRVRSLVFMEGLSWWDGGKASTLGGGIARRVSPRSGMIIERASRQWKQPSARVTGKIFLTWFRSPVPAPLDNDQCPTQSHRHGTQTHCHTREKNERSDSSMRGALLTYAR